MCALMPRLARRAGIEKRVHAHGLRHTHAAELALEGPGVMVNYRRPLEQIEQSVARHASAPVVDHVRRPAMIAGARIAADERHAVLAGRSCTARVMRDTCEGSHDGWRQQMSG